jgi:tripartite-type tricarboxylate transporter receptor subunit TctC
MTRIAPSIFRFAALCLAALPWMQQAGAQAYPSKPVRMIVAFPPAGGADIVARIVAPHLGQNLGQQVVVDNRSGAAGIVGTEVAAKSPPDGYTIFLGTLGNISVNPMLYKKLPFDVTRDLAPLTLVVKVTFFMYAHPSLPVKSAKELIALAKAHPGQINYGSSGAGGAPHLAAALFESMAGIKLVHVPYKGSGPEFVDLLGGHIPLAFDSGLQGISFVKTGKLKALGVLSTKRSPLLPDVPAVAETLPGYEVTNWFGLMIPAATPREIVTRLNVEAVKVLRLPDVRERLAQQGAEPVGDTPEEFGAFIKIESDKWAKVIKSAGITIE